MNYYKITNEKENHNGLQYQDGVITDVIPFNPSGDCAPGGIYFIREDIFAYLSYGPWIRRVELLEDSLVYENPGSPKKWKADKVFLHSRREINLDVIKELVREGANIHAYNDEALRWAAEKGHLKIVKFLVENGANIYANDDFALRYAAEKGYLEIVKFLCEKGADIHALGDEALRCAAENGHLEVTEFLSKKI